MTCIGSFDVDARGCWAVSEACDGRDDGSSSFLLDASYFSAASKPSMVGFSFFAGVCVRVARDEPNLLLDFPNAPFSSGCGFWKRAFGWSL